MKNVYTVLHLFAGIGGGALGTLQARVAFGDHEATFECVGGVDNDKLACIDFETLTGCKSLCADVHTLQPKGLLAFCPECPDVVVMSPPCKGFSGLLSKKKAKAPKYKKMNRLLIEGLFLVLSTWKKRPKLIFVENVPRISSRGAEMIAQVCQMLEAENFGVHMGNHDCGEIGGLGQRRRRWFLLARDLFQMPHAVYNPPRKALLACGDVLGPLPVPGDIEAGGLMHSLPQISWQNWVRLALILPGGDWRDLDGVLKQGQKKREQFRRKPVGKWTEPVATVTGSGGSAADYVADPRVPIVVADDDLRGTLEEDGCKSAGGKPSPTRKRGRQSTRMERWDEATSTVTGNGRIRGSGASVVADPRLKKALGIPTDNPNRFWNKYAVGAWDEEAPTVIGSTQIGSGAPSVADPRVQQAEEAYERASNGTSSQALADDLRVKCAPRAGAYKVLSWQEAAMTIVGSLQIDNGAAAVADPRIEALQAIAKLKPKSKPSFVPIIVAADGSWHRPLTTFELYALQGFPLKDAKGSPVVLAGSGHTRWREAVGNAIPPPAMEAVSEQLLTALLLSDLGQTRGNGHGVWVLPWRDAMREEVVSH